MHHRRWGHLAVGLTALVACGGTDVVNERAEGPELSTAPVDPPAIATSPSVVTTSVVAPIFVPSSAPAAPAAGPEVAPTETEPSTSSAAPVASVWPPYVPLPGVDAIAALTGLGGGPELTVRPALVVKIDNHRSARPQWGLDGADIVFEENVEGITRFVAVFHSRRPEPIGPVRSARSSDLAILAALNRPILAWSGGNPGVTAAVRAAADAGVLVDATAMRSNCYRREPAKAKPHNLVVAPGCAIEQGAAAGPARPPWVLDPTWVSPEPYGPDSTFGVAMDGVAIEWTWDSAADAYRRAQDGAPHLMMTGVQVTTTNVVVLEVEHVASNIDRRSPEAITVGSGNGVLHRDGLATLIRWNRPAATAPFEFTTRNGAPVALATGTAFVELTRAG